MAALSRRDLAAAVAGAATGLLTFAQITWAPDVLRMPLFVVGVSLVPGLMFGAVVAAICRFADQRSMLSPAAAFLITTFAWVVASDAAAIVAIRLEQPDSTIPLHLMAG